jgi:hypothetical protein
LIAGELVLTFDMEAGWLYWPVSAGAADASWSTMYSSVQQGPGKGEFRLFIGPDTQYFMVVRGRSSP